MEQLAKKLTGRFVMKMILTLMFVLVLLSAFTANAKEVVLKEDTPLSVLAKRLGVDNSAIFAMNPHLGDATIHAGQKVISVSQEDIYDALSFCQWQRRQMNKGAKSLFPGDDLETAEAKLKARRVVIDYTANTESKGIPFQQILKYAKAERQRHARHLK
jgi:hypothetical protein